MRYGLLFCLNVFTLWYVFTLDTAVTNITVNDPGNHIEVPTRSTAAMIEEQKPQQGDEMPISDENSDVELPEIVKRRVARSSYVENLFNPMMGREWDEEEGEHDGNADRVLELQRKWQACSAECQQVLYKSDDIMEPPYALPITVTSGGDIDGECACEVKTMANNNVYRVLQSELLSIARTYEEAVNDDGFDFDAANNSMR